MLKGYKTYIIATLIGVLAASQYLGFIEQEMAQTLYTLLTGGGFAALRAGVEKSK